MRNMKKVTRKIGVALMVLMLGIGVIGCGSNKSQVNTGEAQLWQSAVYTEDTELGEGAKTCVVTVEVPDNQITFTIHTDKDNVGDALIENDLIAGEDGDYGIYIKSVNGITADYDIDQSYWAFFVNDDYATTGVDTTPINENEKYRLVYTR